METKDYNINDLISAEYNPRKISDKQKQDLQDSIKRFGFVEPVIVNIHEERKNIIISGHQRVLVAKEMGTETVPCIELNLNRDQEKELNVRMNKAGGEWDWEILQQNFTAPELIEYGFLEEELRFPEDVIEENENDDVVPEVTESICKPGDVWTLGNHRIMCGDSTIVDQVEKLMDGKKSISVVSDPPYNVNIGTIKHEKFKQRSILNDNMTSEEFKVFCGEFAESIRLFSLGCIYIWGPPGKDGRIMFSQLDERFHCSTTIIWNKDQFTLGRGKYQSKYEPCWFGWADNGSRFKSDRNLVNVWDFKRPKKSELHPTMKPVELMVKCITDSSLESDIVLDLFLGSGSTLIACEKTNRICYGMELDPHYCDVIIKRWEEYTGNKATLALG